MHSTAPIADDNAEVFELDCQMVGGYRVYEWRDIADMLRQDGQDDLASYIYGQIRGKAPAERINLARSENDRKLIANAAVYVGVGG